MDQVRSHSATSIVNFSRLLILSKIVRRETSSGGELNQAITSRERRNTKGNRAGCKLEIFKHCASCESTIVDGLQVFVADDAFE